VEKFTLENSSLIGFFHNYEIYEGSLGSGITYIQCSSDEFYMLTDRGPNVFAYKIVNGIPATLIIFPQYTPKIFRVKLEIILL